MIQLRILSSISQKPPQTTFVRKGPLRFNPFPDLLKISRILQETNSGVKGFFKIQTENFPELEMFSKKGISSIEILGVENTYQIWRALMIGAQLNHREKEHYNTLTIERPEINLIRIYDPQTYIKYLEQTQDELKKEIELLKQALEKRPNLEELSKFFRLVKHDIFNLLTAATTYLSLGNYVPDLSKLAESQLKILINFLKKLPELIAKGEFNFNDPEAISKILKELIKNSEPPKNSEIQKSSSSRIEINPDALIFCQNGQKNEPLKEIKRILLLDDDPELRELNQTLLEIKFRGCQVTTVSNAEEAIKEGSHGRNKFDLIILDLELGEQLNGFDVFRKISENWQNKELPVPVILCSSRHPEKEIQEEAQKLGFSGSVNKCFTQTNISDYFKTLLEVWNNQT